MLTAFFVTPRQEDSTRAIVLPCTGLQGIHTAPEPRYERRPALLHFSATNLQHHHKYPGLLPIPAGTKWNRSDPTTHEDHFNLPACWGGTKAEAEAMRAKKAKRRIILGNSICNMETKGYKSKSQSGGRPAQVPAERKSRRRRRQKAEGRRRSIDESHRRRALQVGRSPGSFFGTDVAWTHSTRRSALDMKRREETDGRRDEKTDDKRHTYVRLRTVVTNERNEPHTEYRTNPAARRPTNRPTILCAYVLASR